MKMFWSLLALASLAGCFATVGPDGRARGGETTFSLNLPLLLPPLIVVQPGVSVVSDLDHEVFYSDGYYWARQDRGWYRSSDHRRGWARVEEAHVPAAIVRSPPGQYRRYRGEEGRRNEPGHERREGPEGDHR
jgi:hypothetical protein